MSHRVLRVLLAIAKLLARVVLVVFAVLAGMSGQKVAPGPVAPPPSEYRP